MVASSSAMADPVRILNEAASAAREMYLGARASVAELELECQAIRDRPAASGTAEPAELTARWGDLTELRAGMRSLRERADELAAEAREAASMMTGAKLRLEVQRLLAQASPGHEAEALGEARRQVALTTAAADVGGDGLDPETRLELERIDRLARALRLAGSDAGAPARSRS